MLRSVDWWSLTDVSGQAVGLIVKDEAAQEKMGLIGSTETSVTDHQSTLRDVPEEGRYDLHCGRSPKSYPSLALHFEFTSLRTAHFKLERVT